MKKIYLETKESNSKGITLVALVISIIVLLILAIVSINLLINNGILDKAKLAVDKYSEGEIEEQIKLAYLEYQSGQFNNSNTTLENSIKTSLENLYDDIISVEKQETSIKVSFLNANKTYRYYSDGTIRQIMNPTDVYAKLESDGTLIVRKTATNGYTKCIEYRFDNFGNTNILKVKFVEPIAPIGSTYRMFYNCSNLKTIEGIENLHTDNLNNMSQMFYNCSSLESIDISKFDTSEVTNMSGMFQGCSSLTEIKMSGLNTTKVSTTFAMFSGCSSLLKLNLSGMDTKNITDMQRMFQSCGSLTELNLGKNFIINTDAYDNMFLWDSKNIKIFAIQDTIDKIKLKYSGFNNFEKLD